MSIELSHAARTGRSLWMALAAGALLAACGGAPGSMQDDPGFKRAPFDPGASGELTVCPGGSVVHGIDVSVYQGTINWAAVKSAGKDFAIARISDGTYLDTKFAANWPAMKSAGLVRGAYQFFEPGEDPTAQANIVIEKVGMLGDGDLPVTADMEVAGGQTPATIAGHLQTWIAKVKAGTGKTPMIYTAPGFWNSKVASSAFAAEPFWAANWGVSCPSLATGWSSFIFWQYADNGTVGGISGAVDLDEFNGTLAQLQSFAGAAPTTPAYAAKFVSQTWPLATSSMAMSPGQKRTATIVLKNVGTATWNSKTKLATTQPRDRASPFASPSWPSADRLAAVSGSVPPGATFSFEFEWTAPADGSYDEFYGVVQDGVAWFSDPSQGGPPDNDIEAKFVVSGAPVTTPDAGAPDAGTHDAGPAPTDAGTPHDAGPTDAGEPDAGVPDAGAHDAGSADAGAHDAGVTDAGSLDAGSFDAGMNDAGSDDGGAAADAGGDSDGGASVPASLGGCSSTAGSTSALLAWTAFIAFRARRRPRAVRAVE